MTQPTDIRKDFEQLFGDQPSFNAVQILSLVPAQVLHCGTSPRIVSLCGAAMARPTAELFEYFQAWDQSSTLLKPQGIEDALARSGRWEAAWSVARLHLDQVAKQEAATGQRVPNKGHPL